MIQSKFRTMITLFTLAIITILVGAGCCEVTYRTTTGNAVIHQTPQSQAGSSDTGPEETFRLNNIRLGLFSPPLGRARYLGIGELGVGGAFIDTSGFHGNEFDVSYRHPIPIISNRLYVYPGITLGVVMMRQTLVIPYEGKDIAWATTFLGRGISGLELHLFRLSEYKVRVAIEASWSQSNPLSEWKIKKEGGDISAPDESLRYSSMKLGGYELGAALRIGAWPASW